MAPAPNPATVELDPMRPLEASFRDPSGFVFERAGVLYRQVNKRYQPHFDRLSTSGLLKSLQDDGLLIPHEEVDTAIGAVGAYRVLRPRQVPFISYPFEWCFSQLRDAALVTLEVQARSLAVGMSLKDASAYNVQFVGGRPLLIDTLSFEQHEDGRPWVAYKQFCQHFLAPLLLMARRDARLSQLFRVFMDGVPLDLASSLLPGWSWLTPTALMHVHLHAKAQSKYSGSEGVAKAKGARVSSQSLRMLIDSLRRAIAAMRWTPAGTEWGDYYSDTNYTDEAAAEKARLVSAFHERVRPRTVWDLGANTGRFSRLASARGVDTIAFDLDAAAVEKNYREVVLTGNRHELPLVLDLTNPSPAFGWAGRERSSLSERGPVDLVQVLAVVHHLAISNNVPLPRVAAYLASLGRALVIEFVPKADSQVQRLLASREDVFDGYTREGFEAAFEQHFTIDVAERIRGAERVLYLMRRLT
jgi:ribosomal protein L11 methylase PrmA